ncbi:hypothetical protein UFOVP1264_73 [uncultured Caudovirales phage]|uniref:Uncharacterized protein n=1 Tax=uncultured Caudovirales phage TaxID=2100421 RepID=A0A6J5RLN6_9CAUD|nr:hypothetical protein UFOVP1264_73 [uncultured Caudovirales phage]
MTQQLVSDSVLSIQRMNQLSKKSLNNDIKRTLDNNDLRAVIAQIICRVLENYTGPHESFGVAEELSFEIWRELSDTMDEITSAADKSVDRFLRQSETVIRNALYAQEKERTKHE